MIFDTQDNQAARQSAAPVNPWRSVVLDPDCGGQWVVAGDLDGDGEPEIVSAQNVNTGDVHYTSAVAAQRLDGSLLWRWGTPNLGRRNWHHDVACQVHDWDGDGALEVVVCAQDALVELDGATGREKRRIPIPPEATDCITFCDLRGAGRPTDVLVKDRYWNIHAFAQDGRRRWSVREPGGHKTAHQPLVLDVDGDGRDEIMAGYALLDPEGTVRWVYASERVALGTGHLDCCRVVRRGAVPADFQLALTCCGAHAMALLDGCGRIVWEVTGQHFESVDVGWVLPDVPEPQLVVDIDHQRGIGPVHIYSATGELVARLLTDYARHHALLDWNGDGLDEICVGDTCGIYDQRGTRIATLERPSAGFPPEGPHERAVVLADMAGTGRADLIVTSTHAAHVYRNPAGPPDPRFPRPGSEPNFTLY